MPKNLRKISQHKLNLLLREIRVQAGLKQSELAARLGRPQSYVSKYESGERRLDLMEIHEICSAVGVRLRDVIAKFERNISEA